MISEECAQQSLQAGVGRGPPCVAILALSGAVEYINGLRVDVVESRVLQLKKYTMLRLAEELFNITWYTTDTINWSGITLVLTSLNWKKRLRL